MQRDLQVWGHHVHRQRWGERVFLKTFPVLPLKDTWAVEQAPTKKTWWETRNRSWSKKPNVTRWREGPTSPLGKRGDDQEVRGDSPVRREIAKPYLTNAENRIYGPLSEFHV